MILDIKLINAKQNYLFSIAKQELLPEQVKEILHLYAITKKTNQ